MGAWSGGAAVADEGSPGVAVWDANGNSERADEDGKAADNEEVAAGADENQQLNVKQSDRINKGVLPSHGWRG